MNTPNTINGRTPEEIKKGLECSHTKHCIFKSCPYYAQDEESSACIDQSRADALFLINQLQEDKKQLERERDAAVEDIRKAALSGCHVCKQYYRPDPNVRKYACRKFGDFDKVDFIADDGSIFCGAMEWRGVQEVE